MIKNFYLTVCFIIVQLAAFGQDKTIDFANLPAANPNSGTQLGTTSYTNVEFGDTFLFTLNANAPTFYDYNDQMLYAISGNGSQLQALGAAKLAFGRSDGQVFTLKSMFLGTGPQDQHLAISGYRNGVMVYGPQANWQNQLFYPGQRQPAEQ